MQKFYSIIFIQNKSLPNPLKKIKPETWLVIHENGDIFSDNQDTPISNLSISSQNLEFDNIVAFSDFRMMLDITDLDYQYTILQNSGIQNDPKLAPNELLLILDRVFNMTKSERWSVKYVYNYFQGKLEWIDRSRAEKIISYLSGKNFLIPYNTGYRKNSNVLEALAAERTMLRKKLNKEFGIVEYSANEAYPG